jgi:hypothetical protein
MYENGQIIAILEIIKIPLYMELLQIYKNGQIIALLQKAIYKNGQIIAKYKNGPIIAILEIIKIPSIGNFCKFTKTAKLMKFCKLQFIKTAKLLQFFNMHTSSSVLDRSKRSLCTYYWYITTQSTVQLATPRE